ncbi:MAG: hypothetical protein CM1200mP2_48890 [Planctomycetaceae bacterium]|nr:MAG: hypothetical protein CM1200mP2_48890 [Planctomycetaceae bacterium]
MLKSWGVRIDGRAAEPNTWEELLPELERLDAVQDRCVAVQEYGVPNALFYDAIAQRKGRVMPVPVYRWSLPEDTRPMERGFVTRLRACSMSCCSPAPIIWANVLAVAERLGAPGRLETGGGELSGRFGWTNGNVRTSVGRLRVDIEPAHPKMGPLVRETILEAISRTRPPSSPGDGDPYFARIGHRVLDGFGDFFAHGDGFPVVDFTGIHDHPNFTAGLDGVSLSDAGESASERFEFFQSSNVPFQ